MSNYNNKKHIDLQIHPTPRMNFASTILTAGMIGLQVRAASEAFAAHKEALDNILHTPVHYAAPVHHAVPVYHAPVYHTPLYHANE